MSMCLRSVNDLQAHTISKLLRFGSMSGWGSYRVNWDLVESRARVLVSHADEGRYVNAACPGFTSTNLNNFQGREPFNKPHESRRGLRSSTHTVLLDRDLYSRDAEPGVVEAARSPRRPGDQAFC
jgi:hypothetical protein